MLPATSRRDGFLFDMYVSTAAIQSGFPFGEISVPTLVVTAADDTLASPDNARRLAALIPNARLFVAHRAATYFSARPSWCGDQVRRFIREQAPGLSAA